MNAPWQNIGTADDPKEVWQAMRQAIHFAAPCHDFSAIRHASDFVLSLFEGKLYGYQPLKTLYHNTTHTMEVFLCASRLLHGMSRTGAVIDSSMIDGVLIGALLHDTGYALENHEVGGSGAQFTNEHVDRGISIARRYFIHLPADLLNTICVSIKATDQRGDPPAIGQSNPMERQAAIILATADIVGQMASREYLERLLFLYFEFREAGIGNYADMNDLLEKTIEFYEVTRERLYGKLDGLVSFLALHFLDASGKERNYYLESIDQNIAYLRQVLSYDRNERLSYLNRGGIVDKVRRMAA